MVENIPEFKLFESYFDGLTFLSDSLLKNGDFRLFNSQLYLRCSAIKDAITDAKSEFINNIRFVVPPSDNSHF